MTTTPVPHTPVPRSRAWLSAVVIFFLTAIALADRMAIAMLIGPVKREFAIGDFQASLLVGLAFTLFYMVFLLPIGALADRLPRRRVLAVCLVIWSIATIAGGFAAGFVSLFIARMIVGAGEAAIGPCSHGIIGDSFPRESLARPLALQGIGFQVGPAAGVAAAGAILSVGAAGGLGWLPLIGDMAPWRLALILIGLPGIFALPLVWLLHEPPRRAVQAAAPEKLWPFLKANPRLTAIVFAGAGVSAMTLGVVTGWVPEYMQRALGYSPAQAGGALGGMLLVSAVVGQGGYSVIVDWLAARGVKDAAVRVALPAIALGIPCAWLAFGASSAAAFTPLLFGFLFCIAPFNALNNTLAQAIAPPALRSRISAMMILVISLVGFSLSPALVGALSQYVFGEARLGVAMQVVAVGALVGTLALALAVRGPLVAFLER